MRQMRTISELRLALPESKGSVGLVPTMGFLHAGHMALVGRARAENDLVVVTIFVNPTQFGPNEDLDTYPRDMERDLALLAEAGVDLVFTPEAAEMYPEGFRSYVKVEGLSDRLEGIFRPGHFRGVTTIVSKLFNLVPADRAYFGQKDAQQAVVIRRMVSDLNFRHEIVTVPTVREADGLALSSRNIYLSPEERRSALALSRSLFRARDLYASGVRDANLIKAAAREVLDVEAAVKLDYVTVADLDTLDELDTVRDGALVALAARVGSTRLIDNVLLG